MNVQSGVEAKRVIETSYTSYTSYTSVVPGREQSVFSVSYPPPVYPQPVYPHGRGVALTGANGKVLTKNRSCERC
jgi:hypothetical protein